MPHIGAFYSIGGKTQVDARGGKAQIDTRDSAGAARRALEGFVDFPAETPVFK